MKKVINPAYGRFEDFARYIPRVFSEEGKTIYKARNEVKVLEVDGVGLSAKRYKVPFLISHAIYRLFHQPKAVRAYEHALWLVIKGFETPVPIAYIPFRKKGFLEHSYFTNLRPNYKALYKVGQRPVGGNEGIFHALGTYVVELHEVEVYYVDFSPENVLYDYTEEGVRFFLININRTHFGLVLLKRGCVNFSRLWGREAAFHLMAEIYTESRHLDKAECLRWMLYYRNRFRKKYALKHEIESEL